MQWFDVDKAGLAKLLERRGKEFIVFELLQNAWDENTSAVHVHLVRIPNSTYATLIVTDDNPNGFANLDHAYTLFAESNKKGDAQKRGRFNLGEKLVLAMCRLAEIRSTTGTVVFNETGRHRGKTTTEKGSVFTGEIKLTNAEIDRCRESIRLLIPPANIRTTFNIGGGGDQVLLHKDAVATISASLPTEIADEEGNMRKTQRIATVTLHAADDQAYLYELGIPVVEIDGRFHVNVHQKVPLNFDRDNVSPSYLARIHALTVEHMRDKLTVEDANQAWLKVAVQERPDDLSNETVRKIADLRFGEKRVAYDPSDPEANSIAVAKGYTVVHGAQMSGTEWKTMKRADAILPAGQVTPSPKPFGPDGKQLKIVPQENWTQEMLRVVLHARQVGYALLPIPKGTLVVEIANDVTWPFAACYGRSGMGGRLVLNYGRLGRAWFEAPEVNHNRLLIHEFGHHYSGNHLSEEFYDALCDLGARLAEYTRERPNI